MIDRGEEIRRSVEELERRKRIERAQRRAKKASAHRRGIIGENIGRIRRGES